MRTEHLLAGLATVVAGLAAVSGGPVVQDLVGAPIAAELSVPSVDRQTGSAPLDPEAGQPAPGPRTGDPARAFGSPYGQSPAAAGKPAPDTAPAARAGAHGGVAAPESWVVQVPVALELPDATPTAKPMSPHQAALAWLTKQRGLFGAGQPGRNLRAAGAPRVSATRVAVDFRQFVGGLPVLGSRVTVTMNSELAVLSAGGRTSTAAPLADRGTVDEVAAGTAAAAYLTETGVTGTVEAAELYLVDSAVTPDTGDEPARPMWLVQLHDGTGVVHVLVDARTGVASALPAGIPVDAPQGQPVTSPSASPSAAPSGIVPAAEPTPAG